MAVSLADMKARLTITAGVTGGELVEKFGGKLNTVGKTADTVNKQMASLNNTVRGLAAGFGTAGLLSFIGEAARATIQLDAYSKQLRVGFGGGASVELDKLRGIMRDLGIAQDEALGSAVRFTSALKLSGQTMQQANQAFESASKLILSNKLSADGANRVYYAMAQIASKGKLMAEELNGQLGDVLSGFTAQVAQSMGISTAQLAKAMSDGKVSAEQFFEALNKIGAGIDPSQLDSAAKALGDLKNSWFEFKTGLLEANDIKAALQGLSSVANLLAQNTGVVINVIGGGLAIALARATSATVASTAASLSAAAAKRAELLATVQLAEVEAFQATELANITRAQFLYAESIVGTVAAERALSGAMAQTSAAASAATAKLAAARLAAVEAGAGVSALSRAGSGLSAMLGGPLGIAVIAATVGITTFATRSIEARDNLISAADAAKQMGVALNGTAKQALTAANENRGVGNAAALAEPQIWAFKNATDGLTNSLYEQAKAARAARVEMLNKQIDENDQAARAAQRGTWAGSMATSQDARRAFDRGDYIGAAGGLLNTLGTRGSIIVDQLIGSGQIDSQNRAAYEQRRDNSLTLKAQRDILLNTPIGKGDLPASPAATPTASEGGKGSKGAKGPTAVEIEKSYQDMLNSITQEDIDARQQLVTNTQARFQFEKDALAAEISKKEADLAAKKGLSDTQRQTLEFAIMALEINKSAVIAAKEQEQKRRDELEITTSALENQITMDQLQLDLTTNAKDRKNLQLAIIDAEYKIQKAKLEELALSRDAVEAAKARAGLAQLEKERDLRAQKVEKENAGPLKKHMDQLKQNTDDINGALENVGARGLQSLEDGLMGVMSGTKTVAQAFSEMANQIIADLMRIAIQKMIVSAIGGLFADGGAFSGGNQLFANGGAFSGGVQYFATGGVVQRPTAFGMSGGRIGVMGEAGPEAIMPLRRLPNGRLGVETVGKSVGGQQNNVNVTVNVEGGGSQVASDGDKAMQLGKVISNVVRQELVNQQRPGGLLSR